MKSYNYTYFTTHRNFDYKSKDTTSKYRSDALILTAGKLYLMEGFYENYHSNQGHFAMAVETPSPNDEVRLNTISKSANLTLQYPHDQEKMNIRLMNVASGTFQLSMNSRYSYDIAYNTAASSLEWNLDHAISAYGNA
jgi:hypothetical protein